MTEAQQDHAIRLNMARTAAEKRTQQATQKDGSADTGNGDGALSIVAAPVIYLSASSISSKFASNDPLPQPPSWGTLANVMLPGDESFPISQLEHSFTNSGFWARAPPNSHDKFEKSFKEAVQQVHCVPCGGSTFSDCHISEDYYATCANTVGSATLTGLIPHLRLN